LWINHPQTQVDVFLNKFALKAKDLVGGYTLSMMCEIPQAKGN
jgi:hypothetical protein